MRKTRFSARIALIATLMLAAFAATANAGSYWVTVAPAVGSNGFSWDQTGGWNPWGGGNRCENSATTYATGSYCQLRWNVPANLDPVSGSITGSYRQANSNFEQQMFVEGNGTTVIQGTTTTQSYTRSWADMTSYFTIKVINTGTPQSTSAGTVWFDAPSFTINLVDPYNPGLNILEGHTGWHGANACIRYGFGEAGSGLESTALVNVSTGATYDNPSYSSGNLTTGVFQNDRNCVNAAAPGSGTYSFEARAVDKSGNYVASPFTVAYDVTNPTVSAPTFAGTAVTNGQEFRGSNGQYRPSFSFTSSDGHSGIASNQILLDGSVVANATSWTPGSDLSLGAHTIASRSTDAVGNVTTVSRTINVIDDVAPTFTVAAPAALSGDNTPTLDVTAADDKSGVAPATYTVTVNGAPLVATTATNRLQAAIGTLVNGTHTIVVTVQDASGNTGTQTITYTASSGDGVPAVPADKLTGIYVFAAPSGSVNDGTAVRVAAIMAVNGRPVSGRAEVRKDATTLAGKDLSATGVVDMQVTISTAGPVTLHPPAGSGLTSTDIAYDYVPPQTQNTDQCVQQPNLPACQTGGTGGTSGTGGTGGNGGDGGNGGNGSGGNWCTGAGQTGCTNPTPGTCNGPWPCSIVYYINDNAYWNGLPLAESGGKADKVAPTFKATPVKMKKAWVLKNKQLRLTLWTNELAVVTTQVYGSKANTTASARRKARVVGMKLDPKSKLYKQIKAAKKGAVLKVKVRVYAVDKNGNKTANKWYVLKFKV